MSPQFSFFMSFVSFLVFNLINYRVLFYHAMELAIDRSNGECKTIISNISPDQNKFDVIEEYELTLNDQENALVTMYWVYFWLSLLVFVAGSVAILLRYNGII